MSGLRLKREHLSPVSSQKRKSTKKREKQTCAHAKTMIDMLETIAVELLDCASTLDEVASQMQNPEIVAVLERLEEASKLVANSWSGSFLGYHSRVYYKGFRIPPRGSRFSKEWGLENDVSGEATVGDWVEYRNEEVQDAIYDHAGNPNILVAKKAADEAREMFEDKKDEILSLLINALASRNDPYLVRLKEQTEELKILGTSDLVRHIIPSQNILTVDNHAMNEGFIVPMHLIVGAEIVGIRHSLETCSALSKIAHRAASHYSMSLNLNSRSIKGGTHVFIGHGRSHVWRDLKDFIQDRIGLAWDEFNRVPIAGITNIERLHQMLENAAIAFLIMTAEDEQADGNVRARMNVIHEAGLFQGRLGFTRAIILLEEGCEEFSNIQGLGQIRFPKGKISAVFEEIRQVLEREELIPLQ